MIRITAKKDGFRRCGIAHSKETTEYKDDRFDAASLEILKAEPMLQVEIINETPHRLNATEAIKLVEAAIDLLALKKLAEGEDRKTVLEAIKKKAKELSPGAGE